MRVSIGSDHRGLCLKNSLAIFLKKKGYQVKDVGTFSEDPCDYPDIAYKVAKDVSIASSKRGILICKTGIGNSIVANKLANIRAALCYNLKAAKLSREHNDANILVMGSDFVDIKSAKRISEVWLKTKFLGGRHRRRLNKIKEIEKKVI